MAVFTYPKQPRQRRREKGPNVQPVRRVPPRPRQRPIIATVIPAALRSSVDAAVEGVFESIHLETMTDAMGLLARVRVQVLLISPDIVEQQSQRDIARLLAKNPVTIPVAVIGGPAGTHYEHLIDLGACGVKRVVNVSEAAGWCSLRGLLDDGGVVGIGIAQSVASMLDGTTDEIRQFFVHMIRVAPMTTTVRELSEVLDIGASTLTSRFFRANLPAPKAYLAMVRLVYAAAYFEDTNVTAGDVANALEFSSPQSLGRHVRLVLGITITEFRRTLNQASTLSLFESRLVAPYRDILSRFRPVTLAHLKQSGTTPGALACSD